MLAAEMHGAAGGLKDSDAASGAVQFTSSLVGPVSAAGAAGAAIMALWGGWRYLEGGTFLKFAASLAPVLFVVQLYAWVAGYVCGGWAASCWSADFSACGEFQIQFAALLTVGALALALAVNVWWVWEINAASKAARPWDDGAESAAHTPSPPAVTINILN